jgi:hypothetical protein
MAKQSKKDLLNKTRDNNIK